MYPLATVAAGSVGVPRRAVYGPNREASGQEQGDGKAPGGCKVVWVVEVAFALRPSKWMMQNGPIEESIGPIRTVEDDIGPTVLSVFLFVFE